MMRIALSGDRLCRPLQADVAEALPSITTVQLNLLDTMLIIESGRLDDGFSGYLLFPPIVSPVHNC